ncbi:MAG: hypothetical protein R3282_03860 [Rhodothermales bacterium]|nr:hypothetical protein [Rhodothermales bacterium]
MTKYFCALAALTIVFGHQQFATDAAAQSRWLQTVQVMAPVQGQDIAAALLDSLVDVVDRRGVLIGRTPDDSTRYRIVDLEDQLFDAGLDFSSANKMFITYRFEANQRRFKSDIIDLYFIYRPEEYEDADIPIAYFDASDPIIRNTLVGKGTRLETNEAVFEPFWDKLQFYQLENALVTSVGGRVIRDEQRAESERVRLVGIIRQFLY